MNFINKALLSSLMPVIDKAITDENASNIFSGIEQEYKPKHGNKIVGTITKERDGKVYFCIAEIDNTLKIVEVKKQWKLVEGIKFLVNKSNNKDEQ